MTRVSTPQTVRPRRDHHKGLRVRFITKGPVNSATFSQRGAERSSPVEGWSSREAKQIFPLAASLVTAEMVGR